jgi:WD40 repeat protein/serine/threonine protein kinase
VDIDILAMSDLPDIDIKGYELRELLGKGGFGAVYRAHQQNVQREVALKIILPQYANQPDFIRRFEAEAQLVARLEHPYIVPLYDYWRDPQGAFLVMRMLRGGSLEQSLEKGRWELEAVARLLEQIGSALTTAHRGGVIHQDLKPANILLDDEKNCYLTDFGIAKEISKAKVGEVDDQPRQGTLHYISPEQLSYTPVSFRSDIYSLGIMLYEVLVGKPPFDGKTLDDMVYKHLYENVPSIQFELPDLPEELNNVIAQATAKNPRARYADALTMAAEFRQIVTDYVQRSRQPIASPVPKATNGGATSPQVFNIADIPMDPVNPYKGLRPFQEADSADFFGRETFNEKLLKRLQEPGAFSSFLAVVGPSGSGKSSVVKAGLIPALRKGEMHGSENWFYVEMTPKAHPMAELEQALLKVSTKRDVSFRETLNAEDGYGLFRALDQALPDEKTELVIVIDQFEELYTLTEDEVEREQFLKVLVKAVGEALSRVWIIITLRADFVDRPLQHQDFGNLITERIEFVLPMSAKELEQSIVGPATRVGLKIEGSLVAVIVADVNKQPGALPLLQYALTELYNNRKGITLTLDAYRTMGGISGALARRADELYVQMKNESKQAARQLFLRLITINEGSEATRRRAMQAELTSVADEAEKARIQQIMNNFAKYRLLTFDHDPTTRAPTVEIAHEALVREWDQFRSWIRDSREQLQAQRRLTTATDDWVKSNRDSSFLASGSRLEEFERLASEKTLIMNAQETEYVSASMALKQRTTRIRRGVVVGFIAAFILISVFAVIAVRARDFAETERLRAEEERLRAIQGATISRSQTLALTAITGIANDAPLDLSLLLSVEAWRTYPTFDARNALLTSLLSRPHILSYLNGHIEGVGSVAFSQNPDTPLIAGASLDEQIILWDANTHEQIGEPLVGHTQRVNSVAFNADATQLVSGGSGGQVILWDLNDGGRNVTHRVLGAHPQAVWAVAFSPDGQMVASAGQDGIAILRDVNTGDTLAQLEGHVGDIYTLAFSPDGRYLVTAGEDFVAYLWDISDLSAVTRTTVIEADSVIYSVAFSPDGSLLAAGSADQLVYTWNMGTQSAGLTYGPLRNEVRSVSFAPGSSILAVGDARGTIFLINYLLGQSQSVRSPSPASVSSLSFAPDGCHLAYSSISDTSAFLSNICMSQPLANPLTGHSLPVLDVAISSDNHTVASVSGNLSSSNFGELWLWDTETGEHQELLGEFDDLVTSIAFTPDGQQLAIGGVFNGEVRIWDADSAEQVVQFDTDRSILALAFSPETERTLLATAGVDGIISLWTVDGDTLTPVGEPLTGHTERIMALAFNADGTRLISGGGDNTLRLWDVATGQPIGQPFVGHDEPVTGVAFSPDGTQVVSVSRDETIRFWSVETQTQLGQPLTPVSRRILDVAFSPDGTTLAIGTEAFTVILWDVATRRMLGVPLTRHRDQVNSLAFSSDGQTLVSGGSDANILLWDVGITSWQDRACQIANRSLTEGEWQQYLQDQPFETICPLAQ